jgi:four helix bundle protein
VDRPFYLWVSSFAKGSASELEYQLLLARVPETVSTQRRQDAVAQTVEIKRMRTVLVQKLTAQG